MTLEHADKIAERIIALPKLYESPEETPYNFLTFSYGGSLPWNRNSYKTEFSADNIFRASGFSKWAFSGTITDWEQTGYGHARYITIDDLKMMAYVGIEYARAKLYGWRYRYGELGEEPSTYLRGYIVRGNDNRRYIKRTTGGYAPPNHFTWTPMQRMPGFQSPIIGRFKWPEQESIPKDTTSAVYLLESIEGDNDILRICEMEATYDSGRVKSPFALNEADTFVRSGGFSIHILQRREGAEVVEKYDENQSIVCFQQRVLPIYQIFYTKEDMKANNQNFYLGQSLRDDEKDLYRRKFVVYSSSGMISLKKGVMYDVYAKFYNAELSGTSSNSLCLYTRTPTRMTAPYMWRSKYI